jgi:hypothetical protein
LAGFGADRKQGVTVPLPAPEDLKALSEPAPTSAACRSNQ